MHSTTSTSIGCTEYIPWIAARLAGGAGCKLVQSCTIVLATSKCFRRVQPASGLNQRMRCSSLSFGWFGWLDLFWADTLQRGWRNTLGVGLSYGRGSLPEQNAKWPMGSPYGATVHKKRGVLIK
jgi:hypothetical protein